MGGSCRRALPPVAIQAPRSSPRRVPAAPACNNKEEITAAKGDVIPLMFFQRRRILCVLTSKWSNCFCKMIFLQFQTFLVISSLGFLKEKKLLKYDKLIDHNDLIVCDVFLRKNKTKSKNLCQGFRKMIPRHVDCLLLGLRTIPSTYQGIFLHKDPQTFCTPECRRLFKYWNSCSMVKPNISGIHFCPITSICIGSRATKPP